MSTLEQWLYDQAAAGRRFYLVLDALGQRDEHSTLIRELGTQRYRDLYRGTPAQSLANNGPSLFELDSFDHAALQTLLASPERNWGWLASAENADLDVLSAHWRERLVTGERPHQAAYRFHDNRVLARALGFLQPEQRPKYLGLMASVCYWQLEQWAVIDNPAPGHYPLPTAPAWHQFPTPEATVKGIQFDHAPRYLVGEHTDSLLKLALQQDIDT